MKGAIWVRVGVVEEWGYHFYKPHNERAISADDAWHPIRTPHALLPAVHPVGCDFKSLETYESELYGEGVWHGMHDQQIGWKDDVSSTMTFTTKL